jgi:hypothetical protein
MKKVLLLASGLSAKEINDYDYKANGWIVVAINNGWLAYPNWDHWVKSKDYKGKKPEKILDHQVELLDYNTTLKKYGGIQECGYSVTLAASYYALDYFKPDIIGYLGSDMNYEPNEFGHTHIYGLGLDIQKNKISDPDRMAERYGKKDPNYLKNIYMRFYNIAQEKNTKVYNFSSDENSRLPYLKSKAYEHDIL